MGYLFHETYILANILIFFRYESLVKPNFTPLLTKRSKDSDWRSLGLGQGRLKRLSNVAVMIFQLNTDQINDSGGFLQLVTICGNMLRPLVGFCTIFLALF